MDRNRFNAEVRPALTEIPIGRQGIAFDRLELDRWADDYKRRRGLPGADPGAAPAPSAERDRTAATPGTSQSRSAEIAAFTRALAMATARKRKGGLANATPGVRRHPRRSR